MNPLLAVLFVILLVLQYDLWFGKGGYRDITQLEKQLAELEEENSTLTARNEILHAEVYDLKNGLEAYEERARTELGMIKRDETFFQLIEE